MAKLPNGKLDTPENHTLYIKELRVEVAQGKEELADLKMGLAARFLRWAGLAHYYNNDRASDKHLKSAVDLARSAGKDRRDANALKNKP